jgi:hypothetical protein
MQAIMFINVPDFALISQEIFIQEALPRDISRQRVEHGEDSVRGYSRFWKVNLMHRPIKK